MSPEQPNKAHPKGYKVAEKVPRERRLWKRFTVETACVMAVKPPGLFKKKETLVNLGPLKNVGMKGLSFYYLEKKGKFVNTIKEVSLSVPNEGVLVEKLPFRIVDDFYAAHMPGENNTLEKVRTLCVSFKPLLPKQRAQLESFISEYGEVIKLFFINPEEAAKSETQ